MFELKKLLYLWYLASQSSLRCLTPVKLFSWENLYKLGQVSHIWKILRLNVILRRQFYALFINVQSLREISLHFTVTFISALVSFEEGWWGVGNECSLIFGLLREGLNMSFHRLFILYVSSIILKFREEL